MLTDVGPMDALKPESKLMKKQLITQCSNVRKSTITITTRDRLCTMLLQEGAGRAGQWGNFIIPRHTQKLGSKRK